jgi:hypothetical protein
MPDEIPRRIPAVFYRTSAGGEVVRDWLRGLNEEDRQAIGLDLMRVQYRWPVGMPLCRALGGGLWEVRTSLSSGRIARMLFCVRDATIIVRSGSSRKPKRHPMRN